MTASRHTRSDDGARAAPAGRSGSGRAGDLSALIAKLEAATAGSRELDRAIWLSLPAHRIHAIREVGGHTHERWVDGEDVRWPVAQTNFTASIDCALELVPAKMMTTIDTRGLAFVGDHRQGWRDYTKAATPALALCIAALRARAAA